MKAGIGVVSVVALLTAGAALAAEAPDTGAPAATTEVPPMFEALDADKDGQISQDEAKRSAETQANFEALDSDGDGQLTLAEWSAGQKEHGTM